MDKNDYIDALRSDGEDWIDDYFESGQWDGSDEFSDIYCDMELVITGNDNGSYYCSSAKAKEAIADAMWDEEIVDAVRELGYDGLPTDKGPEAVDVIIRVALLGEVYSDLEDYFDENKPSIENVIEQMEQYVRSEVQPHITVISDWIRILETVQDLM